LLRTPQQKDAVTIWARAVVFNRKQVCKNTLKNDNQEKKFQIPKSKFQNPKFKIQDQVSKYWNLKQFFFQELCSLAFLSFHNIFARSMRHDHTDNLSFVISNFRYDEIVLQ
jgi:hypothetical protein